MELRKLNEPLVTLEDKRQEFNDAAKKKIWNNNSSIKACERIIYKVYYFIYP